MTLSARHVALATALLLPPRSLTAQSAEPVFGKVEFFDLPGTFDRAEVVPLVTPSHPAYILWRSGTTSLTVATADSSAGRWSFRTHHTSFPFDEIKPIATPEGTSALACVDVAGRAVRFARWPLQADTLEVTATLRLDRAPLRSLVADLNGDSRPDLLVYDEREPGLLPVFQTAAGGWQLGRIVAPDLPVRAAVPVFINNDELLDLVIYDWVKSELHTLFGVGRGRYLAQGRYRVDGNVDRILAVGPVDEASVRLALIGREPGMIQYWESDESGDLRKVSSVPFSRAVEDVDLVWDRGTGGFDLIALCGGDAHLVHFGVHADSADVSAIGLPGGVASIVPAAAGSAPGFVALCPTDRVLVAYDASTLTLAFADSAFFAAGARPAGVAAADLNGDGRADLAVANERSGSVSVFWNASDGRFAPQQAFDVLPSPVAVTPGEPADSTTTLYLRHSGTNAVSIVQIDAKDLSVTTTEIPTPGAPEIVGEVRTRSGHPGVAVSNLMANGSIVFSFYSQLGPGRVLERTFRLAPPAVLLGAAVARVDSDAHQDIVFAYKQDDSSNVAIGVAYGDSTFSLNRRELVHDLDFSDARRAYIWSADVDGDHRNDLIVGFPFRGNRLYVLHGLRDSTYGEPSLIDSSFRLTERNRLVIADLDGDGARDIIAAVPPSGQVGWWRNTGDGSFEPWRILVPSADAAGIAVADIDGDGISELTVTMRNRGVVAVYKGRRWASTGAAR